MTTPTRCVAYSTYISLPPRHIPPPPPPTHTHTHARKHTRKRTHPRTHAPTRTHPRRHACTHTHTHIHTYTHTHPRPLQLATEYEHADEVLSEVFEEWRQAGYDTGFGIAMTRGEWKDAGLNETVCVVFLCAW